MQYTELGNTQLRVSRLGFGAMRLPMRGDRVDRELAVPMIHRAFDGGVNYIDTAVGYCNGDSQRVVGEALKGRRKGIVVSTKNPCYGQDEREWWQNLENSLERLGVETIDIYNTHGVNAKRYAEDVRPRIAKWLCKARDQGLIRHICASFHDEANALRTLVEEGFYASFTVQYNLLDRRLEEVLSFARERGAGVVVMGPVGGGRLGGGSEVLESVVPDIRRVPELALRFVLANAAVNVALSGMSTMAQVEENLAVASDGRQLSAEESGVIDAHLARLGRMAELYCTGCGYCLPCPANVNIPEVFKLRNMGRVYGLRELARKRYAAWRDRIPEGGQQADACTGCGACETKCPQHIPVREQLKASHRFLEHRSRP